MGVVLELPAPGVQDAGKTGSGGADEALVFGEPCEGRGGRLEHGVVREVLIGADTRTPGLGDGKGEEEGRPGKRLVQMMLEPLRGCMLLTLGTVVVATGRMDTVLLTTTVARREAMTVVSAVALLDGADDLARRRGQLGLALQGLWRKGSEEIAEGRHGRSPCMRVLRRS
jgi:hypothetical protein